MILITGSSGFIGTNILQFLINKKIKFFGIDKKKNKYIKFKNFAKINLLNKKNLNKIFKRVKPKYIIHLAAESGLNRCHENRYIAYQNNVQATFNLLHEANKNNCRNILLASSFAVDKFYKTPSFYGFTKKTCEIMSLSFNNNFGMNVATMKFSNVFGPYSRHKTSSIHQMIKCMVQNKFFKLHGSGQQKRDFIFVEELIKKIFKVIKRKKFKSVYNINSNFNTSILDIINILNSFNFKKLKIKKILAPKGYDVRIDRAKSLVSKDLIKNLKKTLNWYNSQQ